ncbi:MAG: hypothetical protein ACLPTJ_06895 [Solirubrobacteraceae bacterium]
MPLLMIPVLMLLSPLLMRWPKAEPGPGQADGDDDGGDDGGGGGPRPRKPDDPRTPPGDLPLPDAEQSRRRLRSHRLSRGPRPARRRTHEPVRQPLRSPSRVRTGTRAAWDSRCGGARLPY